MFVKLEKAQYQVKLIEKQGKALTKVISDEILDLNDEREVNDGVYIHHVKISKNKALSQENLNYSVLSPVFMCFLIFAIFQWKQIKALLQFFKIINK